MCSLQSASAYELSPSHRDVSLSFGQTKDNTKTVSFTITNNQNVTVPGDIIIPSTPPHISITGPSSFTCGPKTSINVPFTVTADQSGKDETRTPFTINIGDTRVVIYVSITHYAMLEVSPSSIDFGRVRRTDKPPPETVTIRETLGYKDVNIRIAKKTGNDWLKTDKTEIRITKGSSAEINFTLTPGMQDHNRYSWSFSLSSTTSNTQISPNMIDAKVYMLMPAKLGELDDEELEIKFDEPRGTKPEYEKAIYVRVANEGDEPMNFSSKIIEPRELDMKMLSVYSGLVEVDGKADEDVKIQITAPYYASEGTHHGKLQIDAGAAGRGTVDITIKILWPVGFDISSYSDYFWPAEPAIDFGPLELKEQGYEKREMNLTITENYLYKPVRNLRLFPKGEYGKLWIKDDRNFSIIPPGESRNITVKIEPGLEAVPKDYTWDCDLSASEIEAKKIAVKAKIVPMNISMMVDEFRSFRNSPLYTRYPSSTEVIISNGMGLLELVGRSEIKEVDWKRIPIVTKGVLALLLSLNNAIVSTDEKTYDKAVENLLIASVSLSSVDSNSDMYNRDLSNYAHAISAGADMTTEAVLKDKAKMLELRGWDINNAVVHAVAKDDIRGLTAEENVLEAALSYQLAATVYGLLGDKEKRLECLYEGSMLMDKHDNLVSAANDLRLDAEQEIFEGKDKDLVRIWDLHLLLNPYDYDTASANYELAQQNLEDASKKYRVAGEGFMANNTKEDFYGLKGEWNYIFWFSSLVWLLYVAVLGYIIIRILMGTMAYMRDMHDREVGDIVVT
uniref:Uncharacterized protein n=1 Tax=Uncultured archaeon GZfos26G2 TaxID=3386331 RepID=Q64AA6_UNCAG|nr:hypothetical protein GZ32E7_34 [uncultured archaeon GZfos32E7]